MRCGRGAGGRRAGGPSSLGKKYQRSFGGPLALINPPVLQSATNYTKAELMIEKAQQMLWISGVSITKLSQHTAHLQRLAADPQGEVRFLLIDPESPETVPETGQYVGRIPRNAGPDSPEFERFQRRLSFSLDNLTMLHEKLPERIHIRVVPYQPSMGYFIADCHDLDGFMTASPYFYDTDNRSATELPPFLHLTRLAETKWFDVFVADFEHQWQDARPWG